MVYRTASKEEQVQVPLRVPRKLRERLQKEARRRAVSVNFLGERALADAVDRWEKEKISQ